MNLVKECLTSNKSGCSQATTRTSLAVVHKKGLVSWNERVTILPLISKKTEVESIQSANKMGLKEEIDFPFFSKATRPSE